MEVANESAFVYYFSTLFARVIIQPEVNIFIAIL